MTDDNRLVKNQEPAVIHTKTGRSMIWESCSTDDLSAEDLCADNRKATMRWHHSVFAGPLPLTPAGRLSIAVRRPKMKKHRQKLSVFYAGWRKWDSEAKESHHGF